MLAMIVAPDQNLPVASSYSEVTATEDDRPMLQQELTLALTRLPPGSADFAVSQLINLWNRDRQFYEAALAAISCVPNTRDGRSIGRFDAGCKDRCRGIGCK